LVSTSDKALEFARLEEAYSEELKKLAESLRHPVMRALFAGVAKDSEKHSLMYRSIADLLSRRQPAISEEDLKMISDVIERHIETEAKMLEEARKLLAGSDDPRVKLIAAAIADDEGKHHAVLVSIKKRIAEAETLREYMVWDLVWKDSPWHGAPEG
jgi:rubrerythrin